MCVVVCRREKQVKDLLTRCLVLAPDDEELRKENFVIDVLKVPAPWLHRAKVGRNISKLECIQCVLKLWICKIIFAVCSA